MQLIEASDADGPARVDAVVWPDRARDVLAKFAIKTGSELAEGMQVLLLVVPRLSPRWGFSLNALDIDPAWTVGASLLAAEAIRKRLTAEGIWDRNRKLPEPADFTSVAVIAPETSAGLEDFMTEARPIAANGLCRVEVFAVPFEGARSASSLCGALGEASQLGRGHDAVFVVRGGGAAASLSWLNVEEFVRAACVCRVPVITGIGHETDRVLLDEVSNASFGTPSKAAAHLVGSIIEGALRACEAWDDVMVMARQAVAAARASNDALLREAIGLGPAATMARGYAVMSAAGGPVVSAADASKHKFLEARFADGSVHLHRAERTS